jgi:hypothetical protein
MSNTQFVFLDSREIPDRAALQESVDALGCDLQLAPSLDLKRDTGYSPCTFNGVPVGFELSPSLTVDAAHDDDEFVALAGGRDFCIGLSWGGSMRDCVAAMIVSCALARDFDAVVSFEGDEPTPTHELSAQLPGLIKVALSERH